MYILVILGTMATLIPPCSHIPDKGKCLRKGQAQINYPEASATRYGCSCAEGIFFNDGVRSVWL